MELTASEQKLLQQLRNDAVFRNSWILFLLATGTAMLFLAAYLVFRENKFGMFVFALGWIPTTLGFHRLRRKAVGELVVKLINSSKSKE